MTLLRDLLAERAQQSLEDCPYLTAFWIVPQRIQYPNDGKVRLTNEPAGLGVTAKHVQDALDILRKEQLDRYVTDEAQVTVGITYNDLPWFARQHPGRGPMVVRGVWYPVWRPV